MKPVFHRASILGPVLELCMLETVHVVLKRAFSSDNSVEYHRHGVNIVLVCDGLVDQLAPSKSDAVERRGKEGRPLTV